MVNYKKLLQLAWERNNKSMELIAYDGISTIYYYLGDLEKTRYYHERMWKGITENKNSAIRNLSKTQLEGKRRQRFHDFKKNR